MFKKSLAALTLLSGSVALAACGDGDQRLCTEANWYQTGVYHAQQGYEPRIERLQGICANIGIVPNSAEYLRGYQSGPSMPRLQF